MSETRNIFVAIVGRPNVGKSSLLNRLVGERAAIVSPKPQTTRTRITGILTHGLVQTVLIDTPGIHTPRTRLGQRMTKTIGESTADGDAVMMLFEPEGALRPAEMEMLGGLEDIVAYGVINKADTIRAGEVLAARRAELGALNAFQEIHIVSALTGEGCEALLAALEARAVAGPHFFPADSYTDQPEKQLVAEIIREKLLLLLREEVPHGIAVKVERFHERPQAGTRRPPMIDVEAVIYCERKSHKGIIIGKSGATLQRIGTAARQACEELLGAKFNLQCWVKVCEGWRDSDVMLGRMGFRP
jgi:GTP-binding protein Era